MSYRMSHTLVSFTRPSLVPRFPIFIQIKPMDMAIKHTHYLKYKGFKIKFKFDQNIYWLENKC